MKRENLGAGVFLIEDFLSASECKDLITISEKQDYELATIQAISGPEINKEIRNNDRLIMDDPVLADDLYQRSEAFLPKEIDGW